MVNVKAVGEKYRCNICGNEVEVIKAGGGELVCCGQAMVPLEPAATEGAPPTEMEEAPEGISPEEEAVEEAGEEASGESTAPEGEEPRPAEGEGEGV